MTTNSRFEFPGFTFRMNKDTPTHEVEVGEIEGGDAVFVLELVRPIALADVVNFVVAKVSNLLGHTIWSFGQEAFNGVGLLAKAGDDIVIALAEKGKNGKINKVIPLSEMAGGEKLGLKKMLQLKIKAANFLKKKEYTLSPQEQKVVDIVRRQVAMEEAAATQQREAERQAAREERIKKILSRGKLQAYTHDGRTRYGLPVTKDEWMSVTPGTYVILVDSIGLGGEIGTPIEAFQVLKEKGKNPTKGFPAPVWAKAPTKVETAKMPSPSHNILIEYADDFRSVDVYSSMNEIRGARDAGLNGGSYVAVKSNVVGKYEVYRVYKDRMETLGRFDEIA